MCVCVIADVINLIKNASNDRTELKAIVDLVMFYLSCCFLDDRQHDNILKRLIIPIIFTASSLKRTREELTFFGPVSVPRNNLIPSLESSAASSYPDAERRRRARG